MHIYVSIALFVCLWKGLERIFYAYLREYRLIMTPERDPKQLSLGALWEEASGGGIMEEASCRRHLEGASGGGIIGGGIMDIWEASWTSGRNLEV